jgi:acyl-CoA reductase-like NAD-dependent aldehyde dehydrogenase
VETTTTTDRIFREELFGPVVTVYVYKDRDAVKTLDNVINGKNHPRKTFRFNFKLIT